ncbi:hypothetical protein K7X08_001562 [Anisodus acutangulus]|uniref:Pentatricopeptide repeat-containing protein n=1 Tax=Anisodus acutangulus TaxID=402998 RepID=A0A9Q1RNG4_9SOLA|nr:hypothetical protein K7X08_001562 [Anisodus acutangulus]
MIRAYIGTNKHQEALKMYSIMLEDKFIQPDKYTFTFVLKACTGVCDFEKGIKIHEEIVKRNLENDVFIGTGLIDMYCKMGDLDSARKGKDDVSCGTMMAGYAYNGNFYEVLELFDYMKRMGLKMSKLSAVSALLATGEMGELERGIEIHECAIQEMIDSDVMVATSLMTMYAKCGVLDKARDLFSGIREREIWLLGLQQ